MSIKPVDVGLVIQRMAEVDRVQQAQDQRAAVAQQQFGQEMRARLEQRENSVKAPPDAARLTVNPDARRERQEGRESRKRERKGGPAAEGERRDGGEPRLPGRHLDMKL
ncbi:MAG TPA: hypothetical protein GXX28_07390 [Firmicutes bacterium]|nr:hypothetical protein [Bacillota bacterium]